MQFIRVFVALLAFGQYYHHSSFQPLVAYTGLIVLAATSALAGPIPANSISKKEVAIENAILAREPEILDSELGIIAREPEDIEAREPSPVCASKDCF